MLESGKYVRLTENIDISPYPIRFFAFPEHTWKFFWESW